MGARREVVSAILEPERGCRLVGCLGYETIGGFISRLPCLPSEGYSPTEIVNSDGRREVLGMDLGPSEAETFWTAFLRKFARRDLRGVKLVSDAMRAFKATVAKALNASWHRCRVHFMHNTLTYASKSGRRVVSALIATAVVQDDAEAARRQWRKAADQLRPKLPTLAGFLDEAETDVLAYVTFPPQHWTKLHSIRLTSG